MKFCRFTALLALLTASMFIILAHIVLGYFTFPQVDDFDMAARVKVNSWAIYPYLKEMYSYFSGRLSTFATVWVAHAAIGSIYHVGFFVIPIIVLFIITLPVTLSAIHQRFSPVFIIDTAFVLLVLTPVTKMQTFYWPFGTIIYLLPISLFLLTLVAIHRLRAFRYEILFLCALFLWSLFVSLFHEQLAVGVIGYLGIHIGLVILKMQDAPLRPIFWRMIIMLAAVGIGFAINAAAPGNYVRHQIYVTTGPEKMSSIILAPFGDLMNPCFSLLVFVVCYGLIRTSFFAVPALRIMPSGKAVAVRALSVAIICFGFFLIMRYGYNTAENINSPFFAPYIYKATIISERALLAPQIIIILSGLALSRWLYAIFSTASITHRKSAGIIALAAIMLFSYQYIPLLTANYNRIYISLVHAKEQQASAFSQFDAAIAAHERNEELTVLPPIKRYGTLLLVADIKPKPEEWQNILFATYFGLKQVIMKPVK